MRPAKSVVLSIILGLAVASPGLGQEATSVDPESVARAALRADSAGDWAAMLRIVHPDALAEFRAYQVFQIRILTEPWPGSDMITASLDSTQRQRLARAQAQQQRRLLDSVFQVPSADSLAHLAPDSVYARSIRGSRMPRPRDPYSMRQEPQPRIVGTVRAGDSVAYVVLERQLQDMPGPLSGPFVDLPRSTKNVFVLEMRRWQGKWRSMLDGLGAQAMGFAYDLEHDKESK